MKESQRRARINRNLDELKECCETMGGHWSKSMKFGRDEVKAVRIMHAGKFTCKRVEFRFNGIRMSRDAIVASLLL